MDIKLISPRPADERYVFLHVEFQIAECHSLQDSTIQVLEKLKKVQC